MSEIDDDREYNAMVQRAAKYDAVCDGTPSVELLVSFALSETERLKAQVAELTEANERYRKALGKYAAEQNWS